MPNPGSLKNQSEITMHIDGEILNGFQGLTVALCIDACANSFAFSLPWEATEKNRNRFRPYIRLNAAGKSQGLHELSIYLDETRILTGYLEKSTFISSGADRTVQLEGRSATGPLLEYSAGPPFQFNNIMFNDFTRELYRTLDASALIGAVNASPDFGPIGEISINPGQTAWDVISKLAAARGLWALPSADGKLVFKTFPSTDPPTAVLREGESPLRSISATYDVTKRFQRYQVIGTYEGETTDAEVIDSVTFGLAKRGRLIQQIDQQTTDIESAARYARSRALIDSFIAEAVVDGWHYNGRVWSPGDKILVHAPGAFIKDNTKLIIRRATLSIDEASGQMTTLDFGMPQAFDNSEFTDEDVPYSENVSPLVKRNRMLGVW